MLNRLSFSISLLGMILTLHLWIQKERNFDQGCWGIVKAAAVTQASECNNQELKKFSEFLGVSVAAWGYVFYFVTAALGFGKIAMPEKWSRNCQSASEAAVALAFPFSLYLVWAQAFVVHAFCPLCLISSAFVATLFIIHAWQYWRGTLESLPEAARTKEIGYASGMILLTMGFLAALLIMVDQIGTRRFDQGENVQQFEAMLGRALPKYIEPAKLIEMRPALFNAELPPLDLKTWLDGESSPLGENPALPIVVFLDPNCPSCKWTYATIKLLSARYGNRAQFHVISRTLWDFSSLQSQALELAAQAGKYHDMWQLQFDHAKKGGMGLLDLVKLFEKLDLDSRDLEKRLEAMRPIVLTKRDRAIAAGIRGTPTVYINGRAVANGSTDLPSLTKLIEQDLSAKPRDH